MKLSGGRRATISRRCRRWAMVLAALPCAAAGEVELAPAWSAEASAARGSLEYRHLCTGTGRDEILVLAALERRGDDREIVTIPVVEGRVGALAALPAAGAFGELAEVHRCALFGRDELLVVGRAEDGSMVAMLASGERIETLALAPDGREVIVYDLILLGSRKFAMAGSKHLTGFVCIFDLDTEKVSWHELGRPRASLLSDLQGSEREGVAVCGMEAGDDEELFGPSSRLLVATFDAAGVPGRELRMAGRGCHLVEAPSGTALFYEGGEPVPGPLHLLRLDDAFSVVEDAIVLDQIAYFITLRAAQVGQTVAVLNRPMARERIDLFDAATGRLLGSTRLPLLLSAEWDVVASDQEVLVVSQPRDVASGLSTIRVDAFRLR